MRAEQEPPRPVTVGTGRLEAFSDAVMAVIITILALELRRPDGSTLSALADERDSLFIYVLAFLFIAIYWNNHHHLLRATTRISGAAMWANMLLLFSLSLAPVVTEWIREFPRAAVPVASFGAVSLAAALSYTLLEVTLLRANGRESALGRALSNRTKGYASLAMYAAGVALSVIDVWISYALYVAVAVMWLIPDRRFTRVADE
ncbi:MAG TPA: TMEM175 family protein [Actinomycetota bacterium]